MAGYDQAAARQVFKIPESFVLGAVIALGYQGEPSALAHQELIALETTPRARKPLSDIVLSEWEVAADLG
jgi:hypothetical protein